MSARKQGLLLLLRLRPEAREARWLWQQQQQLMQQLTLE
jgi:hypothetical protein